jgi:hypothetical protein
VPSVNATSKRICKNLYILPGGVAEIFLSKPGSHDIIFQNRKGFVKLSVETGAELVPCYVFGGTDFFQNLATNDSILSKLSRKFRMGLTIFWGQYGLPIPYAPKVTMVIGKPIPVPKKLEAAKTSNTTEIETNKSSTKDMKSDPILQATINELHSQFLVEIDALFNRYKSLAGYPEAELHVF